MIIRIDLKDAISIHPTPPAAVSFGDGILKGPQNEGFFQIDTPTRKYLLLAEDGGKLLKVYSVI